MIQNYGRISCFISSSTTTVVDFFFFFRERGWCCKPHKDISFSEHHLMGKYYISRYRMSPLVNTAIYNFLRILELSCEVSALFLLQQKVKREKERIPSEINCSIYFMLLKAPDYIPNDIFQCAKFEYWTHQQAQGHTTYYYQSFQNYFDKSLFFFFLKLSIGGSWNFRLLVWWLICGSVALSTSSCLYLPHIILPTPIPGKCD